MTIWKVRCSISLPVVPSWNYSSTSSIHSTAEIAQEYFIESRFESDAKKRAKELFLSEIVEPKVTTTATEVSVRGIPE